MKKLTDQKILILILATSLFLRIWNFNFPQFSVEEARLAYRAYSLSETGKDELGRDFPLLFNSLEDYKFPLTSYFTAASVKIFGKNDFGVRIPFIIIGTFLPLLVYFTAFNFTKKLKIAIYTSLTIAFSPALIFLSKVPNETIILTFLISGIFYFYSKKSPNILIIILLAVVSMLVSKYSLFIMPPFLLLSSLIFKFKNSKKIFLSALIALFLSITIIYIFLQFPQALRSFKEHNLTLLSDITIKNGIEKLRMQGIQAGWPPLVERLLFNKLEYLSVGFLHWFSNLSPNIYFGQFDNSGTLNYSQLGVFTKITIVPFLFGLILLFQKGLKREKLLLVFIPALTFPSMLVYPKYSQELVILTVPFLAYIIAFGLARLNFKILNLILFFTIFELIFNLVIIAPEVNYTTSSRPSWIPPLVHDIYNASKDSKVGVSDNIVSDIVPYILWLNPVNVRDYFIKVDLPYKYRQTSLKNIQLIGFDNSFYECSPDENVELFLSNRDIEEISKSFDIEINKKYEDSLRDDVAYKIKNPVCIN